MRAPYQRTYTLNEVVAIFCRLSPCTDLVRRILVEDLAPFPRVAPFDRPGFDPRLPVRQVPARRICG